MIKLFFLTVFLFTGQYSLKAAQEPVDDQGLKSNLENTKSPFDDGIPPPVVISQSVQQAVKPVPVPHGRVVKAPALPVLLPPIDLEGVIVGDTIHQAIMNDEIVPLHGIIEGARLIAVTKKGAVLLFKGKKFFLKVN